MFWKIAFILPLCITLNMCKPTTSSITDVLDTCKKHMRNNQHDSALFYLAKAFDLKMVTTSTFMLDEDFYQFIQNVPESRPIVRTLLQNHCKSDSVCMANDLMKGQAITIHGLLIDTVTKRPIKNVLVEFIHTNTEGKYFTETGTYNPTIFGYVKTNEHGKFIIHTNYPGVYKNDAGFWEPPHIHFNTFHPKFRAYNSEFILSDTIPSKIGSLTAVKMDTNTPNTYTIIIPIQAK